MSNALLEFFASAAIIVVSGISMARTADTISRVTGLGHLLGGALPVATATSLPELLVGINAVNQGWVDLAVGDLLGAAVINMLVLAALDTLQPSRGRMLSRAAAAHALSGRMSMTLLALVGIAVFIPDSIDVSVARVSIWLWLVVGAYFLGCVWSSLTSGLPRSRSAKMPNACLHGHGCSSRWSAT
ncbi:MAG TPA: hypothetical protein VHK27_10600 [Gammaproteobacteria bacterium]|nr:hypothetical protein [Gammaproteobacteria bacterium]